MSAITQTISAIVNISFANGKIDHSKIKTQEEERIILWLFTLCFLKSKGKFPSSSTTSAECMNGVGCHRYACGQLMNKIYDFIDDNLSCKGVSGCTYHHEDEEYYSVDTFLQNLDEETRSKISSNIEIIGTIASNKDSVSDPIFFRGNFCYDFANRKFCPTAFPKFNLPMIFENWDNKKFPNVKNIPQEEAASKALPQSGGKIEFRVQYDPAIISTKSGKNISYSGVLMIPPKPRKMSPSQIINQITTGKPVSQVEMIENETEELEKECEKYRAKIEQTKALLEKKKKEKEEREEREEREKQQKELLAKAQEKKTRISKTLEELRKEFQRVKNEKV